VLLIDPLEELLVDGLRRFVATTYQYREGNRGEWGVRIVLPVGTGVKVKL